MFERDARRPRYGSDPSGTGRVAGLVTTLTLTAAFGALALGVPYWWVAFPVGFGGVMPLAVRASERASESTSDPGSHDDALATLRDRYARGAIDEAEFERRVEGLLATEDGGEFAAETARERAR